MKEVQVGRDIQIFVGSEPTPFQEVIVAYLYKLYAGCNELAQAKEESTRPDLPQLRQPCLQHVYVDLETTASSDQQIICSRLGLTEQQYATVDRLLDSMLGKGQVIHTDEFKKVDQLLKLEEGTFAKTLNKPTSAFEAIQHNPQVVLLGDPGGGKSTLTQRLAGVLASEIVAAQLDAEEQGWLDQLKTIFGGWLLPIRIELSRWARHLSAGNTGNASDLIGEIVRLLMAVAPIEEAALRKELLLRLSRNPAAILLLLDGLDEVTDEAARLRILQALAAFRTSYRAVPLVVTCRSKLWQSWSRRKSNNKALWPLHDWPSFTLAPLASEAQRDFVQRWHSELTWAGIYPDPESAQQAQNRLLTALNDPNRRDLQAMAGTPLLLTMMARINRKHGLPDTRAELYSRYVKELLWEWERSKLDDRGELTSLERLLNGANVKADMLEEALVQLAYEVHAEAVDQDSVEIPRHQLEKALRSIYPNQEDESGEKEKWCAQVLKLIYERSGLIYATDHDSFRFRHRTFQEYLAARWLTSGDVVENFAAKIDDEAWREAIFLAFGHQISVANQADSALMVLNELLPNAPATAAEWKRVNLLGEVFVRLLGEQRVRQSKMRKISLPLLETIPDLLTRAMQRRDLPARQRLDAGLLLTRGVNDPPGHGLDLDPPGLDDLIQIPRMQVWIGKYPVPNKQFKRFVDAGGYGQKEWWSEDGWKWKIRDKWTEPRYWHNARFNRNSQPVVGVSWYEAEAYCAWATGNPSLALPRSLQDGRELSRDGLDEETQWQVRLPSEAEWSAAAHAREREYPWGNDFDPSLANTKESNLGQTTPVCMYSAAATSEGVLDLCGNVWEWLLPSKDGRYWQKGGSWLWDKGYAKPSARVVDDPYLRLDLGGFRCVFVPISR